MNRFMKFVIFLLTAALILGLYLMPILIEKVSNTDLLLVDVFNSALNFVKQKNWQNALMFLPFVLVFGISGLCLLAICLKTFFGMLGRKKKIKVFGLSFTILIFMGLFYAFVRYLPAWVNDGKIPNWMPEMVKEYLLVIAMAFSSSELGIIVYLAMGFCVVVIILGIIGNIGVKRNRYSSIDPQPYAQPQPYIQPQPYFQPQQQVQTYCRNCGTANLPGSQFCGRCGTRL